MKLGMTKRWLGLVMDGNELQEWREYAVLEPFGEDRMDLRFAKMMAFLYNSMRGKSQPEMSAADFLPDFLSDPDDKAPQESGEAAFLQMTQLSGGEVLDGDMSDADIETYLLQEREWGEHLPQNGRDESEA